MIKKRNSVLFLSVAASAKSLFAGIELTRSQIIVDRLMLTLGLALNYPFALIISVINYFNKPEMLLMVFLMLLEVYIVHRLLKQSFIKVVPRMIFINVIDFLIHFFLQTAIFFFVFVQGKDIRDMILGVNVSSLYKNIMTAGIGINITLMDFIFAFVLALIQFFVRVMISYKMYGWLDKTVNKEQLKKTMLIANGLSYAFAFVSLVILWNWQMR